MRVWPKRLPDLHLRLPPGWYVLPAYMPRREVRRLLELLGDGLEGIEHVVELDFAEATRELTATLRAGQSVVFLSVPDSVSDESIATLRTRLGSVRVGLIQRDTANTWPEVAWQERHIKVPLLRALEHEFRRQDHPLAELGIENVPIAELAKLTPEPVELLEMLGRLVEHRLSHARWGMRDSDWSRSVRKAAAERLALRLGSIPSEFLSSALDRVLGVGSGEDDDADRVLACVGLAWIEGNDVVLSALAELGTHPDVVSHLVLVLPKVAWSTHGGRAAGLAVAAHRTKLRAAWVIPDLPYSKWPAVVPTSILLEEIRDELSEGVEPAAWSAERHALIIQIGILASRFESQGSRWHVPQRGRFAPETEPSIRELLDVIVATVRGYDGDVVHRFEALDRASAHLRSGPQLTAFVRWYEVMRRVDAAADARELMAFEAHIHRGVELANGHESLTKALMALLGDVQAKGRDYRAAKRTWQQIDPQERNFRLLWRRSLAHSRLGEIEVGSALAYLGMDMAEDVESEASFDPHDGEKIGGLSDIDEIVKEAIQTLHSRHSWLRCEDFERKFYNRDTSLVRICHAGMAIESGDWPHAVYFAASLDRSSKTSAATHARVLWAWLQAVLGDSDAAATTFDELRETAQVRGDRLLLALAERGWAESAVEFAPDLAAEAHARADALERELGVVSSKQPDSHAS